MLRSKNCQCVDEREKTLPDDVDATADASERTPDDESDSDAEETAESVKDVADGDVFCAWVEDEEPSEASAVLVGDESFEVVYQERNSATLRTDTDNAVH